MRNARETTGTQEKQQPQHHRHPRTQEPQQPQHHRHPLHLIHNPVIIINCRRPIVFDKSMISRATKHRPVNIHSHIIQPLILIHKISWEDVLLE